MAQPPFYVPIAADMPTPTRDEIVAAGCLRNGHALLLRDVLAGPADPARRDRWALPAGKLAFNRLGLMFLTTGKRVTALERFLGRPLAAIAAPLAAKGVESMFGALAGDGLASTVSGVRDRHELAEAWSFYDEALESPQTLFLPLDRICAAYLSFENRNPYGILQLDVIVDSGAGGLVHYEFLARDEDGARVLDGTGRLVEFLRLNYEQRVEQGRLLARYAGDAFAILDDGAWNLNAMAFGPDVYARAAVALVGTPVSVEGLRREALQTSLDLARSLAETCDVRWNVETPDGNLYDLIRTCSSS